MAGRGRSASHRAGLSLLVALIQLPCPSHVGPSHGKMEPWTNLRSANYPDLQPLGSFSRNWWGHRKTSQDPIAKTDISNSGPSNVWSFHQRAWTLFAFPGLNGILILRNSVDQQNSRFGPQDWKVLPLASETFQTEPYQSVPQTGQWLGCWLT